MVPSLSQGIAEQVAIHIESPCLLRASTFGVFSEPRSSGIESGSRHRCRWRWSLRQLLISLEGAGLEMCEGYSSIEKEAACV